MRKHLEAKIGEQTEKLSALNQDDFSGAKEVARNQLLRTNGRLDRASADLMIAEFCIRERDRFQLVQRGARNSNPRDPPPTTTTNRFSPLPMEEPQHTPGEEEEEIFQIPPTPRAKHPRSTPTSLPTSKRPREEPQEEPVTVDSDGEDRGPVTPEPRAGTDSPHHGSPVLAPPETPATEATPGTRSRLRLSAFYPQRRREWAIPEINEDESVLLITDSNGSRLAQWTPPSWRVAAYHGANTDEVARILESSPIPDNIKLLLVHVGVNDRLHGRAPPLQNAVERLKRRLEMHARHRHVRVIKLPHFDAAPTQLEAGTNRVNAFLEDQLGDTPWLIRIPDDFRSNCARDGDYSHYASDSGEALVWLVSKAIADLN